MARIGARRLKAYSSEGEEELPQRIEIACDAIKAFCLSGIQFAMCNFNNNGPAPAKGTAPSKNTDNNATD